MGQNCQETTSQIKVLGGAFLLWVLGHTPQKPLEMLFSRVFSGVENCYSICC